MFTAKKSIILFVMLLSLVLSACASGHLAAQTIETEPPAVELAPIEIQPVTETELSEAAGPSLPEEGTPEWVALRFFEAYRDAAEKMEPTLGNPEFTAQQYLSEEYLNQVAEIEAGFEGVGFNPILQAQMVPPAPVEIKESVVEGDLATVVLQFGRGMMPEPWERTISLEKIFGEWKIVPDKFDGGGLSPEDTVQAFYDWYLSYIGTGEDIRNPLVDQAYRAAPYLSTMIIADIDHMIEKGELMADPLLCAQDVPEEVYPLASFDNASRPSVVMGTSFSGHTIVVDLVRSNFNMYSIKNITCGRSPSGTAKAFYTWALGYMTGSGEFRNPWADGAYVDSPFLSQAFIQSLDKRLSSDEPLIADPVFFAQELPQSINSSACPDENCAFINLQYGTSMFRQLKVEMVMENGNLVIDRISHPEGPEAQGPFEDVTGSEQWVPFVDEQYGYALRYPSHWQVESTPVSDLHTPEEYALMRSVRFTAPDHGEMQVSYSLDIRMESEENLAMLHPEENKVEEVEINGVKANVYRSDPGFLSYIFRHPTLQDTWLVFNDPISQFPGRETLAEQTAEAFQAMLSTITFK